MLQVDAKRRITLKELLIDPWMMEGYDKPVKWQSKYHSTDLEVDIVNELSSYKLQSPNAIADRIRRWDYDYVTATYFLLMERKQKGLSIRLTPSHSPVVPTDLRNNTPKRMLFGETASPAKSTAPTPLADSPRGLHNSLEGGLDDVDLLKIGQSPVKTPKLLQNDFERSVKNRASERYPVPHKKTAKIDEDKENCKPKVQKPQTPVKQHLVAANSPLSPSRSMDSGLNTPKPKLNNDWVFATPEKPISKSSSVSNRKVLGSIERGLDKMKNMLTPRKGRGSEGGPSMGPAVVTGKALCNVSTTSQHNPDNVLNELTRALVAKGIPCQQKGYILRGKIKDATGYAKLSFELEVCRIPNLNVIGIRRKRLKGDAWCYKKVCEEVLRLAACT